MPGLIEVPDAALSPPSIPVNWGLGSALSMGHGSPRTCYSGLRAHQRQKCRSRTPSPRDQSASLPVRFQATQSGCQMERLERNSLLRMTATLWVPVCQAHCLPHRCNQITLMGESVLVSRNHHFCPGHLRLSVSPPSGPGESSQLDFRTGIWHSCVLFLQVASAHKTGVGPLVMCTFFASLSFDHLSWDILCCT